MGVLLLLLLLFCSCSCCCCCCCCCCCRCCCCCCCCCRCCCCCYCCCLLHVALASPTLPCCPTFRQTLTCFHRRMCLCRVVKRGIVTVASAISRIVAVAREIVVIHQLCHHGENIRNLFVEV